MAAPQPPLYLLYNRVFGLPQAIVNAAGVHTKKAVRLCGLTAFFSSGANGNRTSDTRIFSPLLYQLSYGTIVACLRVQSYGKILVCANFRVHFLRFFLFYAKKHNIAADFMELIQRVLERLCEKEIYKPAWGDNCRNLPAGTNLPGVIHYITASVASRKTGKMRNFAA